MDTDYHSSALLTSVWFDQVVWESDLTGWRSGDRSNPVRSGKWGFWGIAICPPNKQPHTGCDYLIKIKEGDSYTADRRR